MDAPLVEIRKNMFHLKKAFQRSGLENTESKLSTIKELDHKMLNILKNQRKMNPAYQTRSVDLKIKQKGYQCKEKKKKKRMKKVER